MINRIEKLLRECLASGNAGAWLERHPEHREQLLPYLELHTSLLAINPTDPWPEGEIKGLQRLMRALSRQEDVSRTGRLPAAFMRLGTVAAALVLTLVAVAGASAAFGDNDFVDGVFSSLGFSDRANDGINGASLNADHGRDCASPNAFEGHGNAEDVDNTADAHEEDTPRCAPNGEGEGQSHSDNANTNASDRAGNADDRSDNANPNATQGSDNADEGSDNANPDAGPPEGADPSD